jgi:hypothetical protein
MTPEKIKALTRRLSGRGTVTLVERMSCFKLCWEYNDGSGEVGVTTFDYGGPIIRRSSQLREARALAESGIDIYDFIDTTVTSNCDIVDRSNAFLGISKCEPTTTLISETSASL